MRSTGFTYRWILPCAAATFALWSCTANAQETARTGHTEIVRGDLLVFNAPDLRPASRVRGEHEPKAPRALRTVVLPEVRISGSPVQPLPRGTHIDCGRDARGVVSSGLTDARGMPLPAFVRCL